jgi:drug/metabolite transporter (DMT)-like permease
LLLLAAIWGGAFFFIGVAVRHVPPLTYVWLRLTIAAAGMGVFLKLKGEPLGLPRSAWGSMLLLAFLNNALPFTLFGWGQTHIASGLASILNATTPIWGVVVAHIFTHDERMTPRKIAGVLLGFGGVATMIGPALLSNIGSNALAQLACVTASLSYALAAVWARRFRRMGLKPMAVTTGQLTAGAAMMFPLAIFVDQPWTHPLPPLSAWGAIIALGLMCSAFAYVLYFRLIDSAGATNALLVTLLVPPVAIRGLRTVVLTDGDDAQPSIVAMRGGELVQRRQFLDARGTPGGPQVHEHGYALELGKGDVAAIGVLEDGVGGGLAPVASVDAFDRSGLGWCGRFIRGLLRLLLRTC